MEEDKTRGGRKSEKKKKLIKKKLIKREEVTKRMPKIIADLHLHSRYAQGCSKNITITQLAKWAKIKGIDLLGTGDFTHPLWFQELQREFVREEDGIYYTRDGQAFLCSTEVSLIYTDKGEDGKKKGRRIHLLILAPSLKVVQAITAYFLKHGRVDYDGRPIFHLPAWRLVKELRAMSEEIEIIPAHIWTPWFSLFGSKSGFDSLTACFKEESKHIHAIETGLSSDIEMNDRLSQLAHVRYVSFSDSHSFWPWRLGREATIFELEKLTYQHVLRALRTGEGFWGTIEVEPAYGKYHADGHRKCHVHFTPSESRKHNNLCPVCHQPLTIGVWNRVEELADRPPVAKTSQPFYKLLPLHEIISLVLGKGLNTKRVWKEYWTILKAGKNEYDILLNATKEKLLSVTSPAIAEAILAFREGNVTYEPGYDGVYGKADLKEQLEKATQKEKGAQEKVEAQSESGKKEREQKNRREEKKTSKEKQQLLGRQHLLERYL